MTNGLNMQLDVRSKPASGGIPMAATILPGCKLLQSRRKTLNQTKLPKSNATKDINAKKAMFEL